MTPFYIDFHCHPAMKPYGKGFTAGTIGINHPNASKQTSAWFYDSPNLFERGLQMISGISKFSQADFSTLSFGDVRLVCASLYPIEQGFFKNKLGEGILSDLVNDFITGVGKERVDFIQSNRNYFEDLEREYKFYESLDNKPVKTVSGTFKYKLIQNFAEMQGILQNDPMRDQIVFVVMSIEGLHTLNMDHAAPLNVASMVDNVKKIKQWKYPPLFVTFAHHFNNFLCGHSKSLTGIVGEATDQSDGLGEGFSTEGRAVLDAVLSRDNGKRIYIDIKHMSAKARAQYFNILSSPPYAGQDIPILVSHGAANGLKSMNDKVMDPLAQHTASKLLQEDINFYDDEIVQVARSKGIFGLQLDERRVANKQTLQAVKHSIHMSKIRHYRAELLWNQIQHVAELLDRNHLPAWDCLAIGSDFEGIINPLNGYLTAEALVHLEAYVERYAFNYMCEFGKQLQVGNQLSSSEIVQRIFHSNGINFMSLYF